MQHVPDRLPVSLATTTRSDPRATREKVSDGPNIQSGRVGILIGAQFELLEEWSQKMQREVVAGKGGICRYG